MFVFNNRYLCILLLLLFCLNVAAQNEVVVRNEATAKISLGIEEVALIKVTTGDLSLTLKQREAGLSLETSTSDSTARVLISSVVTAEPRTLSASITGATMAPPGTKLEIMALPPNEAFVGNTATFLPPQVLEKNVDKPFVTQIMTCYSGTELSDGYPLKFTFSLDGDSNNYSAIRATSNTSITVTLTLTVATNATNPSTNTP